jgi:hypothetical protein
MVEGIRRTWNRGERIMNIAYRRRNAEVNMGPMRTDYDIGIDREL